MPGKLTYFDLGGRAEGIRSMLHHAGHQYEDCRKSFPEWATYKAETPMGSMPLWEEDGFTTVSSSAILRVLGVRLGYYSDNHLTAYKIDSIVEYIESM